MTRPQFCSFVLLAAGLGGCAVGPDYHPPSTPVPESFAAAASPNANPAAPNAASGAIVDAANWWHSLDDRELDSLVERAIVANPDIQIALDRLQEARTLQAAILGTALPVAGASGAKAGGTGSDVTRGRVAGPLHAADNAAGIKSITEAAGFDMGWELDLFGKYRREIEAARYDVEAAAAARNAVLTTVIADVARAYFDLRGLQMQLAVANRSVATAQKSLDYVQARYDHGLTNALDLTLARRELATLQADVAPLNSQINAAQYVIGVLLGQYPESIAGELAVPGVIPLMPPGIAPGLPLDLLRRRPDIREEERKLGAATARTGVATANLFPHIGISGGIGVQNSATPGVMTHIWSFGPSAFWTLLDFGTLDALVDLADLQTHEQLIRYKATVLRAVQDVDTSIGSYAALQDRLGNIGNALIASQDAVGFATQRYERGLTDYLNLLDAQRQEYALETKYAMAQRDAADEFVSLYKGLGGGWENYQTIPDIRQPQPAVVAMFKRLFVPANPEK
jgi:NodT family efflux transporter outer membrane factor (OMF) lipoprotein